MKMKRLIVIALVLMAFGASSQTLVNKGGTYTYTVDLAALSGTDTSLNFIMQEYARTNPYSVNVITTDSVRANTCGVYLKACNDGINYGIVGDSLAVDSVSETYSAFFTGTSFPYTHGELYVSKGAATAGTLKIVLYVPQ